MNRNLMMFGAAIVFLAGCSSSYKHNEFQSPEVKLDQNFAVLISTPENGWYGETEYKHSGQMTANAIRSAFSKNTRKVAITADCKGKNCLDSIDSSQYGYYVEPIILHWEDRATEWSGKADKVEIQIITYDTKTKKEIGNTTYSGKSKWLTFGGDHPQDLLEQPTHEYIGTLYK
ncbi:DUF4823 domain-containing protein [Shewanella sp. Choline-02u-19]|uniref:DUF4823 domain-containing protein n=1 Tax=unclassified Shewanella TaxID=196818 RepID=UPI000C349BAE|nr:MULTISPECIES: DUF4823 domain-containing protein [unclassified Shewanella]PKG57021.1 DUF4823 domain-containing protein [Shewanella sp. GutDb-MelDb]PKH54547.1 DUF4823 domain-containing protein [Shewanella sp. Bg11-22]PKI28605.1 DUF4823 domain-containing protein [Shewanella sp. Choline-02u-19]